MRTLTNTIRDIWEQAAQAPSVELDEIEPDKDKIKKSDRKQTFYQLPKNKTKDEVEDGEEEE